MTLATLAVAFIALFIGLAIPVVRGCLWWLINRLQGLASGEFLLAFRPNGGDVVLVRSIWTASLLFCAAIGIVQRLEPGATWAFSATALRAGAREHIEWFGALLAAAYVTYYSRFAAQWTYLAGLYNQIMGARAQTCQEEPLRADMYAKWWAAFIEDAQDVHLALKPSYAVLIGGLLKKQDVRDAYIAAAAGGQQRIENLESRIASVLHASDAVRAPIPEQED